MHAVFYSTFINLYRDTGDCTTRKSCKIRQVIHKGQDCSVGQHNAISKHNAGITGCCTASASTDNRSIRQLVHSHILTDFINKICFTARCAPMNLYRSVRTRCCIHLLVQPDCIRVWNDTVLLTLLRCQLQRILFIFLKDFQIPHTLTDLDRIIVPVSVCLPAVPCCVGIIFRIQDPVTSYISVSKSVF